ncbi:MAG: tRNA 2-thiouridine(34) synthase MnmA [Candidatus Moranbacteria bacterium CG2_30_41_165]|nr:MAG: tRNA 2-thiouridine(34) synthase MnmA [Candidatus Moranbacteria bacterium CG2_30_41_165]PIP25505.1 MAG: tRNA 2-thiouridine(34) synthase MnmA [Candidatus Moranbacteria bacterium CG23_combo_of_CG06-09_8_20_14_all_41_28]PJC00516.1 MAG: tRNA 2-thiouridine(34) synthase MnmA [Candidatus Moranbacteria bacterium CG_4_9_14_0_8_um_filter_41_43]
MKIAVLVSGGVDSSVALRLLLEEGHDVTAFYLKIWLEDELAFLGECPWEDDLSYVRAVCDQAHIPLEVVPFQKEYWERVVAYTIDEVKNGRTPNPDMLCNARIKFGAFYEYLIYNRPARNTSVSEMGVGGFDKIATGHYAQVAEKNGKFFLKKTPDSIKDQTYFLSQLSQKQLSRALFPIGKYEKKEVRKLAEKFSLMNAKRKDSQGICFLGKIPFNQFLKYHLGEQKGDLVNFETGEKVGEHSGFWYFTVGQRQGIGLSGGPFYVVKKDPQTNTIFIASDRQKVLQSRDRFVIENANWFLEMPADGMKLSVKLRHGPKEYGCTLLKRDEYSFEVLLDEKDSGIAEGQFAVFYDGEMCLGGGAIKE